MKNCELRFRDTEGDLTLPFFGFVLVAALTIASLTSISQYNIIVEKLNAGLEEADQASVKYILDNVSDSALIGALSPAVQAELINARNHGVAVAQTSLSAEIKDLIAVRNGDGVNVFDIADSSITKDASDNVIIQFAVEAQVLPPPTPKYKRVFKKVVAKPFSLNSRELCIELECPPGNCGECGVCDECTGTCIPYFNVPDGQGGFKNPDTESATANSIACKAEDNTRIAFVTSSGYNGNLVATANNIYNLGPFALDQGIEAADALCNRHAQFAGLSGNYIAIISKRTFGENHIKDRLPVDIKIEDVNGTLLHDGTASGNGWIFGLLAPLDHDENGNQATGFPSSAWTGSQNGGEAAYQFPSTDQAMDCSGWAANFATNNLNPSNACTNPVDPPGSPSFPNIWLCNPSLPPQFPSNSSACMSKPCWKQGSSGNITSRFSWLQEPNGLNTPSFGMTPYSCHQPKRLYCIEAN